MGAGFYLGALAGYVVSFILIALFDNYRAHLGKKTEALYLFVLFENKQAVSAFIGAVRAAQYELFDLAKADADIVDGLGVTCALRRKDYKHFNRHEAMELIHAMHGVIYAEDVA